MFERSALLTMLHYFIVWYKFDSYFLVLYIHGRIMHCLLFFTIHYGKVLLSLKNINSGYKIVKIHSLKYKYNLNCLCLFMKLEKILYQLKGNFYSEI